jgi:serine/threonine-protein kinase
MTALLRELASTPEAADGERLPLLAGTVIGRYEVQRELGRGAFGVVYEARDRELLRAVALKVVQPGTARTGEAQLAREAEAVARLSHPNLVTIHDLGRSPQGPYLVFELLRGRTLQQRIDAGPVPVEEAVHVAAEVARGLAHAHAEGVLHRDLKPSNVFVTERGQVKVLDFGMAHAFGRQRVSGGTPAYMAPEQWLEEPEDERTDVFALGVMLYRMLAGTLPFPKADGRWASAPVDAPGLSVPAVPALEGLVARMLARAPAGRPRDGAEVLAALERIEEGLHVRTDRATPAAQAPPAASRRRATRAAIGLALLSALLGLGWLTWQRGRGPLPAGEAPSVAVLAFADLSPQKDQEYLADGISEEILNVLTRVDGLKVIARTSSFFFKGKTVELKEIGRRLGVTTILEGSLRREGSRVRVTAQLVKAADGVHLWSQNFEREFGNVFAIQDDIAREVAGALRVKLQPGAVEPRAASPEAYAQHLLAAQIANQAYSWDDWQRAEAAYEKVLTLDPNYAPTWARLATVYGIFEVNRARDLEGRRQARRRGLEAADRAIALAPDYGLGYAQRGYLRLLDFDLAGADADTTRALGLNPADSGVMLRKASLHLAMGRLAEAVPLARKAVEHNALGSNTWQRLAFVLLQAGDLPGARQAAERSLEISPTNLVAALQIAFANLLEGKLEPVEAWAKTLEPFNRDVYLSMVHHARGRLAEAEASAHAALSSEGADLEPYDLAQLQAWRGRNDEAFAWLERAREIGEPSLPFLANDPLLKGLHADPRWRLFLAKLKLPS